MLLMRPPTIRLPDALPSLPPTVPSLPGVSKSPRRIQIRVASTCSALHGKLSVGAGLRAVIKCLLFEPSKSAGEGWCPWRDELCQRRRGWGMGVCWDLLLHKHRKRRQSTGTIIEI